MKPFKAKQQLVCGLLILSGAFYLVDCLVVSTLNRHTDLPWIERGIYAPGPAGILTTASCVIAAFWMVLRWPGRSGVLPSPGNGEPEARLWFASRIFSPSLSNPLRLPCRNPLLDSTPQQLPAKIARRPSDPVTTETPNAPRGSVSLNFAEREKHVCFSRSFQG